MRGLFRRPEFHLALALGWALLLVPTLLWWKASILWVASMSLYANIASHWSGYQAARAERIADLARKEANDALPGRSRLA